MKILQINVTCGHGSTGVIAVEIANLLNKNGHESYIAYGQGSTDYHKAYKIGTYLENKIHGLLYTRILGKEGFGTKSGTKKLVKWIDTIEPDLIHIHTLHSNYLNYNLFFNYLRNKRIPVVWSLFDCWAFTGKCTHFTEVNCRKWETECSHCPQLHTSGPRTYVLDRSKKLYRKKKAWFTQLNKLNIIVCSEWLKKEVGKSFFKDFPIHMIYNWIDTEKFKEIHDNSIFAKYNLDPHKKILLSVGAGWTSKNTRFADAVRLADILPDEFQLVLVGGKDSDIDIPKNIKYIPYIAGTEELSKLYSAALVYVYFSVEDTFGKVIAEAMLCGTPAIVFNSTACPEVVGDTGYVVAPHNVEDMLKKIETIAKNGREFYSQRCKDYVTSRYGYEQNVMKYLYIYKQILKNE